MGDRNSYRIQLNNYLQTNGGLTLLSWSCTQTYQQWTATAYIDGAPYARVTAKNQTLAKEEAARQTLAALISQAQRKAAAGGGGGGGY